LGVIGGGGYRKEEYLKPRPDLGFGANYPDVTATKGDVTIRINTVSTLSDGITPTLRELKAINSINGKGYGPIIVIPKGTGLGNLPEVLKKINGSPTSFPRILGNSLGTFPYSTKNTGGK
jgi:hypothetical protein